MFCNVKFIKPPLSLKTGIKFTDTFIKFVLNLYGGCQLPTNSNSTVLAMGKTGSKDRGKYKSLLPSYRGFLPPYISLLVFFSLYFSQPNFICLFQFDEIFTRQVVWAVSCLVPTSHTLYFMVFSTYLHIICMNLASDIRHTPFKGIFKLN